MATISEIAARMNEANARTFSGRQLDKAANERIKILKEEGNIGNAAEEGEIDITEGNVGPEGDEFPGTVHLDAEGRTFGMTETEAEALSKFHKCLNGVDKAFEEMKLSRPTSQAWWGQMRDKLQEGKFLEVREEIYQEMKNYQKHTVAGEVDYVLSLQQVYDRI
ncbi:uncharacterized protein TrAFT101_010898 [Trichoderma asperellum]|uniref:Uncharacterized protein n=1 Tax=Trichoderma asperellum (strain ATCC 204424 / CBS 433.97 / NBRC 101777) TaxID=1042311 RepID=A0A2T3YXB7_TRIA4|nr:hypothetical protein M441DRAFT_61184 [Trichoderma asperellum CBS 433.97]PTB37164.1 hypothetical protein M441DRAFT_61184 [Trichoderma asperellum CBS 433.97]UKZ96096.1 hypothetical protein TrAFT101_010898 [Trichoderma asperellum]